MVYCVLSATTLICVITSAKVLLSLQETLELLLAVKFYVDTGQLVETRKVLHWNVHTKVH